MNENNNINQKLKLAAALNQALPKPKGIELTDEQVANLKRASEIALAVIAVAGIATLIVVAPNALQLLDKFVFRKKGYRLSHKQKQRKLAETFYYLKRSGLIQLKPEGRGWRFYLTQKGRQRVERMNLNTLRIARPKVWNGKWWLVAADIPTKEYKASADLLRLKLKQMGFYPLQRTLWLYPYNPSRELQFILETFNIANFVTTMEINRLDLEDERVVKAYFKKMGLI